MRWKRKKQNQRQRRRSKKKTPANQNVHAENEKAMRTNVKKKPHRVWSILLGEKLWMYELRYDVELLGVEPQPFM